MSAGGCAVAAYALPSGGFMVWCLEHGGELSRWVHRADADRAVDRHRALMAPAAEPTGVQPEGS